MDEPRMIGHYRIVELLGSGAMGTVHVAVDTFIERTVAIKSLRAELTRDPDFVSRFRAEATSLARLNHPNITTLIRPFLKAPISIRLRSLYGDGTRARPVAGRCSPGARKTGRRQGKSCHHCASRGRSCLCASECRTRRIVGVLHRHFAVARRISSASRAAFEEPR